MDTLLYLLECLLYITFAGFGLIIVSGIVYAMGALVFLAFIFLHDQTINRAKQRRARK